MKLCDYGVNLTHWLKFTSIRDESVIKLWQKAQLCLNFQGGIIYKITISKLIVMEFENSKNHFLLIVINRKNSNSSK